MAGLALVGCASAALQTDAFLKKAHDLPQSRVIEGVPFYEQAKGQCGPATLAMSMSWAGKPIAISELIGQVYTPGMQGSVQLHMISASRRHGMLAIPIEGLDALLTEVAAGHPVIVFENLGISWYPAWHYAVVFGYDLGEQTVVMHSGPEAFKRLDLREFERSWKLGGYWGLVVLPPGELAATADELTQARAATALEQLGFYDEADKSYRKILERWPLSLTANVGAANMAFNKHRLNEAIGFLVTATASHPDSAVAWHNLAIAYGTSKQRAKARRSARQALQLASAEIKAQYQERLKPWVR